MTDTQKTFLDTLHNYETQQLSSRINRIKEDATIYSCVQTLLDELTIAQNQDDGYYMNAISSLIYNISGGDIQKSVGDLHSFIGNFLLDDVYFTVEFNGRYYEAKGDNDNGKQDVDQLIMAAKFNAEYYQEMDERIQTRNR